jgi:protein dithiol oxidoreductase (disulfide-forming)
MLKKIKLFLFAISLPLSVMASEFEEGKHYITLDTPKSKAPQVTEFFSFYCPHCFKFEPVAKALEESLPAGAQFKKSHVNFLGGKSTQAQRNLSYAYLIAKQFDKEKDLTAKIFDSIHVKRAQLINVDDIKTLFELNGITAKQYDDALSSMPIISAEKMLDDSQIKYTALGALKGVPTFIVNDKYQIVFKMIRNQEQLNKLVAYLISK